MRLGAEPSSPSFNLTLALEYYSLTSQPQTHPDKFQNASYEVIPANDSQYHSLLGSNTPTCYFSARQPLNCHRTPNLSAKSSSVLDKSTAHINDSPKKNSDDKSGQIYQYNVFGILRHLRYTTLLAHSTLKIIRMMLICNLSHLNIDHCIVHIHSYIALLFVVITESIPDNASLLLQVPVWLRVNYLEATRSYSSNSTRKRTDTSKQVQEGYTSFTKAPLHVA